MNKAEAFVRKVLANFPGNKTSEADIKSAARKVEKAFPPRSQMSGWQPIGMALNDGVPILCLNADTGEIRVGVRKLLSNQHHENTGRHWYEWFRDEEFCSGHTWSIEPTHWMRLPSPPPQEDDGR